MGRRLLVFHLLPVVCSSSHLPSSTEPEGSAAPPAHAPLYRKRFQLEASCRLRCRRTGGGPRASTSKTALPREGTGRRGRAGGEHDREPGSNEGVGNEAHAQSSD